jgi:hypothetical protein
MTFEEWWLEKFGDNLQPEFKAHMKEAWGGGYFACMDDIQSGATTMERDGSEGVDGPEA